VEKLLSSGWSDLSREMRPGNVVGALGVLYIGRRHEVRGQGRKSGNRWWIFNTGHFETEKEREGNRGGTGGAPLPLSPSMAGHPMAVHGAAASVGAVAARVLPEEGDDPGWASLG
jgi:hypothetical protein